MLRDPRKRRAYDDKLAENAGVRMQLAEAKAAEKRGGSESRRATTDQGRQFHQKATAAVAQSDWLTARNHLQMALTFEPKNDFLKQELEQVRAELEAAKTPS